MFTLVFALLRSAAAPAVADWPVPEGAAGGGRFWPLPDIMPANVSRLD